MGLSFLRHTNQLDAVRMRFAEGGDLPPSLLPTSVARSWQRSRQAGVQPGQRPEYDGLRGNPREHPEDRRLAQCCTDKIERLWAAFGGRDWIMFCVNPQGMIVHSRQHPDADPRLLRPLQAGRRILEADIGTTAPSCTLADDAPMLVRGDQHYLTEFEPIFCLSVPLHGVDGELIGALDMTGLGERDAELLMGYFRHAALESENRLYAGLRDCHLLRLQYGSRWLESSLQGLLALYPDGRLRAANFWARKLLDLPTSGRLPAISLEQLLPAATPMQRRRLFQSGAPKRLPTPAGTTLYVEWMRGPKSAVGAKPKPAAMRSSGGIMDLHQRELLAVQEALCASGGNVSAAARQLGVSRTTLYKKMREGN